MGFVRAQDKRGAPSQNSSAPWRRLGGGRKEYAPALGRLSRQPYAAAGERYRWAFPVAAVDHSEELR